MGMVAGLRPVTATAIIALAARRKWIHLGNSPFARLISGRASRRITELAISELIADKLPFTPSRLSARSLASRVASGVICGATVCGAAKCPLGDGVILGGLGAVAGALSGYYVRRRLQQGMPDFAGGLLEDALAISGGAFIMATISIAR
jgi:uncharacterized membrane protein